MFALYPKHISGTKGYCNVSVAPLRASESGASEMVSSLLFGESVTILERSNDWLRVSCDHDGYEGWIHAGQIVLEPFFPMGPKRIGIRSVIENTERGQMEISFGSMAEDMDPKPVDWDEIARYFLNTPYLWGGRSIWGIDCSGLVQICYAVQGIQLPRDAWQQAMAGETIDFLAMAQPGDVAFFDNSEGKIIHTGILLNEEKILHAHGRVRVDEIDQEGIFNREAGGYTHKLRFVKRINL